MLEHNKCDTCNAFVEDSALCEQCQKTVDEKKETRKFLLLEDLGFEIEEAIIAWQEANPAGLEGDESLSSLGNAIKQRLLEKSE